MCDRAQVTLVEFRAVQRITLLYETYARRRFCMTYQAVTAEISLSRLSWKVDVGHSLASLVAGYNEASSPTLKYSRYQPSILKQVY